MFPEPSSWLPLLVAKKKAPWINVSFPLGKATKIFYYFTFSLPLPVAVLLPHYIQDADFYSEFFEVHKV